MGFFRKYGKSIATLLVGAGIMQAGSHVMESNIEKRNSLRHEYINKHIEWLMESCENRGCDSDYITKKIEELIDKTYSYPISSIKENLESPITYRHW